MARPPTESRERVFRRSYTGYSLRRVFWFSGRELKHLAVGAVLVTLVALSFIRSYSWSTLALALLFTSSFLLHEMAHKFTAQRSGLWSEFRLVTFGAVITALSIISPFKIIAPGAVVMLGAADLSTIGKASAAGPLTNIALGFGMLLLASATSNPLVHSILYITAYINGILALFNLIPFGILDGQKVMAWNVKIWALAIALSLILVILTAGY